MQEYSTKVTMTGIVKALHVLEDKGLVWHSNLRCQCCGTDDDVYETHRDLIDASRQVNVCGACLISTTMRVDDDAFRGTLYESG